MPRLTSNSVSMSLRMYYLSCVKMQELHCPAKTQGTKSLHLEGDTVPTRWRFYCTILSGRSKQIICHFKADTYDIKLSRQNPSRVYGLKEGTNNRTTFSKISINLVFVGFCYHGNRQSYSCTWYLK